MDIGSRESFSATEGEGDGKEALLSNNGGKRKKEDEMEWKELVQQPTDSPLFLHCPWNICGNWEERKGQEDATLQKFFSLSRGQRLLFPFFPGISDVL